MMAVFPFLDSCAEEPFKWKMVNYYAKLRTHNHLTINAVISSPATAI